jgi:hypothetical protein
MTGFGCFDPVAMANAPLQDFFSCGLNMAFGNAVFVALFVFLIMLYGFHKLKIPMIAAIPFGVILAWVLAGAGNISNALGALPVWQLGLLGITGLVFVMVFAWLWGMRR